MAQAKKQPTGDYEIGRGKPPKATQFKKGQSGNPKGRPKGSKNAATVLKEVLSEKVTVRDGVRTRKLSQMEVMIRKRVMEAVKGDARAYEQVMKQLEKHEKEATSIGGDRPPVLVVPGALSEEEWAEVAKEQQAKWAGNTGEEE